MKLKLIIIVVCLFLILNGIGCAKGVKETPAENTVRKALFLCAANNSKPWVLLNEGKIIKFWCSK